MDAVFPNSTMTRYTDFGRKRTHVGDERSIAVAAKKQPFSDRQEARRRKRFSERLAGTTCLACREKGHRAKACPNFLSLGKKHAADLCYRCGSHTHSLPRCTATAPSPTDPSNPLPFASCFVCSARGHLASTCPKNKERGVYPNGGACLLCKEVTHLAKDCPLRRRDNLSNTLVVGTGTSAGADEDDFHVIGRVREELHRKDQSLPVRPKKIKAQKNVQVPSQFPTEPSQTLVHVHVQPKKVVVFKG